MASHAPDFGRASTPSLSAVLGAIPSYPRPVVERLVARLIDHLDAEDGDPDMEPNGDEADYSVTGWCAGRYGSRFENDEPDDFCEAEDGI